MNEEKDSSRPLKALNTDRYLIPLDSLNNGDEIDRRIQLTACWRAPNVPIAAYWCCIFSVFYTIVFAAFTFIFLFGYSFWGGAGPSVRTLGDGFGGAIGASVAVGLWISLALSFPTFFWKFIAVQLNTSMWKLILFFATGLVIAATGAFAIGGVTPGVTIVGVPADECWDAIQSNSDDGLWTLCVDVALGTFSGTNNVTSVPEPHGDPYEYRSHHSMLDDSSLDYLLPFDSEEVLEFGVLEIGSEPTTVYWSSESMVNLINDDSTFMLGGFPFVEDSTTYEFFLDLVHGSNESTIDENLLGVDSIVFIGSAETLENDGLSDTFRGLEDAVVVVIEQDDPEAFTAGLATRALIGFGMAIVGLAMFWSAPISIIVGMSRSKKWRYHNPELAMMADAQTRTYSLFSIRDFFDLPPPVHFQRKAPEDTGSMKA